MYIGSFIWKEKFAPGNSRQRDRDREAVRGMRGVILIFQLLKSNLNF